MTDDSGKCRGFGFVGFEDHESAQKVSGYIGSFEFKKISNVVA